MKQMFKIDQRVQHIYIKTHLVLSGGWNCSDRATSFINIIILWQVTDCHICRISTKKKNLNISLLFSHFCKRSSLQSFCVLHSQNKAAQCTRIKGWIGTSHRSLSCCCAGQSSSWSLSRMLLSNRKLQHKWHPLILAVCLCAAVALSLWKSK